MLSPEIEKLLTVLVTVICTVIPTWLIARPKQKAEVTSLNASTERDDQKMFYQMAVEMQEKLPLWIKRFEDEAEEKTELKGLLRFAEGEMHRLSKELKNCQGDNSECRKIIEEARAIFTQFENALNEVAEHAPLLSELKDFRRRIEKIEN